MATEMCRAQDGIPSSVGCINYSFLPPTLIFFPTLCVYHFPHYNGWQEAQRPLARNILEEE